MLRIKNAANVATSLRSNNRISFNRATAIQPTIMPTAALTYGPILPALRFRALRTRASVPDSIPSSPTKFLQAHEDLQLATSMMVKGSGAWKWAATVGIGTSSIHPDGHWLLPLR
jgi:hypothetical protein